MLHKFITLLVVTALFAGRADATVKHALIIAIGNYPQANGWQTLSSIKDAEYIRRTLVNDSFEDRHITTVADGAATVQGITAAFGQLVKEVSKGDVVVIHFSCHGEQVESIDPAKPGGLDQCVVTYNALIPRLSTDFNKDQAAYYRGQTIGAYLQELRRKLGPDGDVVVFMDYCHSGAGTRGVGKQRGGSGPFLSHGTSDHKFTLQTSSDLYEKAKNNGNDKEMATFVAISATRPEEVDLETVVNGEGVGSLTYAISKSFEHLDPGTTYRTLFAKIQSVINQQVPQQHPMIEGNGLDRTLFGGKFVAQKPYIEIDDVDNDNNRLTLRSGVLAGLDMGAKIALYRSGTNDPAKAIAITSGTVIATGSFSATVQLDKNSGLTQPADGWVFVTEPAYHIKPIIVRVETNTHAKTRSTKTNFTENDKAGIEQGLKDLPLVSFTGEPDLLVTKGPFTDSLIAAIDGTLIDTVHDVAHNPQKLNRKIQDYAKYKFIKDIELKSEDANVTVRLVPVKNGIMDTNLIKNKMAGGLYTFHNNDTVQVVIKNNGTQAVYVNILDLQPDGKINAVLPNRMLSPPLLPNDLKINPGEERLIKNYVTISPPYGTEVFKVFVSKEEINMEGLMNKEEARQRGITPRGNLSVMEQLVNKSNGIATRDPNAINSESADGTTYNVIFRIEP